MSAVDDGGKRRWEKGEPEGRQPGAARGQGAQREHGKENAPLPGEGRQPVPVQMENMVGRSDAVVEEEVWEPGRVVLGLYEVRDELGKGGMGVVHRVRHRSWNHWMAVKSPRPEVLSGARGKEEFISEAELWVNLPAHPNIVTCHYVRTIGGIPRIFAEYVDGGSLKDRIAGGQLTSLDNILDIAIQMAWGLALAHGEGLVHQDMKPANVMLTSGGTAKITDFGLARARARATGDEVAGDAGGDVGVSARGLTKAYASPEQMAGERLSGKTDIWSWAVTVLDMFVGGVSCELGPAAGWTLEEHLKRAPEHGLPAMPKGLAGLLRRCFAAEPEERPGDFEEIADELREFYREATGKAHAREVPQKVDFLADGLNNRALSMLDLGKADEAERLWKEALARDSTHPASTCNLGLVRWRNARVADAALVRQLEEVCRTREGDWLPPYLLALVHLERDDTESAVAVLEAISEEGAKREEVIWALERARERAPGCHLLRTFEENEGQIMSVCLGRDGSHCLTGNFDSSLKLWSVSTGECVGTFVGHRSVVNAVCINRDGGYALSGSADKTLKLWEVATGCCLRTYEGHDGVVTAICLSSDGNLAVSGSFDKTLKLWDVNTGECLRTFVGHTGIVWSVCLSADGKFALSNSADETFRLWNVANGECVRTFEGSRNPHYSPSLSMDGRYVIFGDDNALKLCEATKCGRCVRTFLGHEDRVISALLSEDGRLALSASEDDGTLRLWEVATGRCVRTFESPEGLNQGICLDADARHALSHHQYRRTNRIDVWHVCPGVSQFVAPPYLSTIVDSSVASREECRFRDLLASAAASRERGDFVEARERVQEARFFVGYERSEEALAAWSALYRCLPRSRLHSAWEARTLKGHTSIVMSVCLSADGCYALSGSQDKTVRLWDTATGECMRVFKGDDGFVRSVCLDRSWSYVLSAGGSFDLSSLGDGLSAIERLVALSSYPRRVNVVSSLTRWNVRTGEFAGKFGGHDHIVDSVCLSEDGQVAVSGSHDRTVKVWDVSTGKCLRTLEGHTGTVTSVCLSADRQFALSGSEDCSVKVWRPSTGECLRTLEGHEGKVNSVCVCPDGRRAISASDDRSLKLWDTATGERVRTFEGHEGPVLSVCVGSDGMHACSGGLDKTLKLWEVSTGKCLRTLQGHKDAVESVCFSADGRYVLSGGYDHDLKLWFLDWELEEKEPADWDEGAQPYVEVFIRLHTPLPFGLFDRRKPPSWAEDDFQHLLHTLGCAGYGWLRPDGVRRKLEELAKERTV